MRYWRLYYRINRLLKSVEDPENKVGFAGFGFKSTIPGKK
jgi:hypothetical protein